MILLVSVQSAAWIPVIVERERLEYYWQRDSDYYPIYGYLPHESWFPRFDGNIPVAFRPGVAYFSKNNREGILKVHFNNGRHRTRWLLEQQAAEIVIALAPEGISEARKCGLVHKILENRDTFNLGFIVSEIEGRKVGEGKSP